MNLEKIELLGFKSFADKTEIKLTDGVTGIVGPNGCGKSNISDAIRWVLGEQAPKQLRGSSMQDVIFNGTEKRKSLSYCEVSLYFNNEGGKLFHELEYQEVIFTRKLFRNGDSEYYINKQPARMRDIVDFLHECGVSREGYTIIGQGKVSEILSSKPEDRRAIFEEAVGIAKTKNKKRESERRLDRTRENIIRIIDKTTELEKILEPLAKQAEKTRSFRALSEELKYHEINTYLYKHDNANTVKEGIMTRIRGFNEQIAVRSQELEEVNEAYRMHQEEISLADDKMKSLHNAILAKSIEAEKIAGQKNISNERISFFRSEIERIRKDCEDKLAAIVRLSDESAEKQKLIKKHDEEIKTLTVKAKKLSADLATVSGQIQEGERLVNMMQSKIIESAETLASINADLGSLSAEKNVISSQHSDTLVKVEGLIKRKADLLAEKQETDRKIAELERNVCAKRDNIKETESSISDTNRFISELGDKIYKLNADLVSLETNLKIYSSLKASFDGYGPTVKNLMAASGRDPELKIKIKGGVGAVISTEQKYETAIETAMGGYLQNVITATPDDAQYLFKYLKRIDGGRINCLPMSALKVRQDGYEITKAVGERGALGLATKLVRYDAQFDNAIRFVLGNTLICDVIDNATAIAKKYNFAFKIVTLDGDVISPSGTMSGGSKKKNTTNLLAMDRHLQDTEKQIREKKAEMEKYETNKQNLLNQVNELVDSLDELNKSYQDYRQKLVEYTAKKSNLEEIISSTDKDITSERVHITEIENRIDEISGKYADVQTGSAKLMEEKSAASGNAQENQAKYDKLKAERDNLIAENTSVQTRLAELNSALERYKEDVKRIGGEIALNQTAIETNNKNIESDESIIENLVKETAKMALSDEENQQLQRLRENLADAEKRKEILNAAVEKDNADKENLTQTISKLNERKFSEENSLTRVDAELEYLQDRIFTEYQETYDTCKDKKDDNYDIMNSAEEINRLKKKISSLGSINANAIEDYETYNASYQEYMTQKADLEKAEADLKEAIGALTDEMTKTFDDGFEKIRTNFQKTFKELFGGGKADLVLDYTDCTDPLDAGVEIMAEPPGKKLQKISLLSGGEMALTAIAILFAILRLRPMPFCVLDEIEAPLDEANVERFAKYLKNFSKDTQFIVITHKKVTMELCDALHGVTMEEKGVSKTVSVKFADLGVEFSA